MKSLFAALKTERLARVTGLPVAGWPWVAHQVSGKHDVVVVVAPEAGSVTAIAAGLRALVKDREVAVFPSWDVQPYDRLGPSAEVSGERQETLAKVRAGGPLVIVTNVAALGVMEAPVASDLWRVSVGGEVEVAELAAKLVDLGYKREDVVQEAGSFAVRGGIIDVWPAASEPVRMELFGDEVERLRTFDPASQKSLEDIDELVIGVAGNVVLDDDRMGVFRTKYREHFPNGLEDDVYVAVSNGILPPEAGQYLPLFYDEPLVGLLDVLPETAVLMVPDNLDMQAEVWDELIGQAYAARHAAEKEKGSVKAVPPEQLYVSGAKLQGAVGAFARVEAGIFDDGEGENLGVRAHGYHTTNRHGASVAAAKDVASRIAEGWSVVLTAQNAPALAQFLRVLEGEGGVGARSIEEFGIVKGSAVAAVSAISAGWVDGPGKVFVLADSDVFGARMGGQVKKRRRSAEEVIAHFSELKDGDYVVHENHGIGKFAGLLTMQTGGVTQDFLKLLYAGDDRLFVPVENLDLLSRYKGSDAGNVVLDRLGTGGWEIRKAKVKEDLMAMAGELLATAAARQAAQRAPIERTPGLYDEFCAGFAYPLTDDQQRVMDEIEDDFANGTPMDRLVVGDVGFGKTEVALRSAFLMASAGRQVAVVCPTTLLARQHYENFKERFEGFPLTVGRLSRLVSTKEAKEIKQGLAKGTVDIVVGTHALLSKDLDFARLGMVVIDEEQRFGVAHKEKLKTLRAEVDVLTLTATPIPRTLQMAVGGVRQLSLITTPPVDRQAVTTMVLRWDNVTLKGAITRELVRGGQVYVVAPHVEDLPRLEDSIRDLVPEARIGVAHGQMAEGALEPVMEAFYEGKIDILLATTIIESGLDVPRANTMIVYRADRFGLAQLYQLRGRVGRSTAKAFAYFLLPESGVLSGDSAKRLQILQRLDGLGAGFTLASYDMDLRGFGNLLGKQQSGHIRDIGFELYAKMLKDAVETKQRRSKEAAVAQKRMDEADLKASSVSLKLGISYLIPEKYVSDVATRLQLYRRLANLQDAEQMEEFRTELADRFGELPHEVQALLAVVDLKNRAAELNVAKVEVGEKGVVVGFEGGRFKNPEGLVGLVQKLAGVVTVRPAGRGQELVWHRRVSSDVLRGVGVILSELESAA
ncbi:MAG: transcription-repair coupling factor [Blastochloris viridis]|uniref:Transcription-repair-coupling factor n=1 Tax=Blastochloris viridis TaxID=1079 RepID=A0A6N4R824_BLAVI|nr:MAG: transcription-repair coupling factor [Blastochloris viridis]